MALGSTITVLFLWQSLDELEYLEELEPAYLEVACADKEFFLQALERNYDHLGSINRMFLKQNIVSKCTEVKSLIITPENISAGKRKLALELQKEWGVAEQIDKVIENVASKLPAEKRQPFFDFISKILSDESINNVSVDSAVEVFTQAELDAMLKYYSSAQGKSAESKRVIYNETFLPRIQAKIKEGIDKVMPQ